MTTLPGTVRATTVCRGLVAAGKDAPDRALGGHIALAPKARKTRGRTALACLLFLTTVAACGPGEPPSPADAVRSDPVAMQRGRLLFNGTCGGYCHGTSPGPRDAPYLFDCTWLHGGSDEDIFRVISEGVPKTRMVSFGGNLPEGDDDIWRLVAYITSKVPKSC